MVSRYFAPHILIGIMVFLVLYKSETVSYSGDEKLSSVNRNPVLIVLARFLEPLASEWVTMSLLGKHNRVVDGDV